MRPRYDLVCGEGRLEAFRMLDETEIPAVVIDAAEADCLVMSLVENLARRHTGRSTSCKKSAAFMNAATAIPRSQRRSAAHPDG